MTEEEKERQYGTQLKYNRNIYRGVIGALQTHIQYIHYKGPVVKLYSTIW